MNSKIFKPFLVTKAVPENDYRIGREKNIVKEKQALTKVITLFQEESVTIKQAKVIPMFK